jgi:hypothetical protein
VPRRRFLRAGFPARDKTHSQCSSRSLLLPVVAHALRYESRARFLHGRFGILLSRQIPRPECWAALKLFGLWCYKKAESRRARLFPRCPTKLSRAYRGSIELASNATQIRSVAKNHNVRLRIFTENIRGPFVFPENEITTPNRFPRLFVISINERDAEDLLQNNTTGRQFLHRKGQGKPQLAVSETVNDYR